MYTKDVIKHFGGKQKDVADALGISESYVSRWGELVPKPQVIDIVQITNGALKYDPSLYKKAA